MRWVQQLDEVLVKDALSPRGEGGKGKPGGEVSEGGTAGKAGETSEMSETDQRVEEVRAACAALVASLQADLDQASDSTKVSGAGSMHVIYCYGSLSLPIAPRASLCLLLV